MDERDNELIPTRATLLHRLKDWQDQASWQDFFAIYSRLIYGVASQAGLTKTEAQDVVQETMMSVARHMPDFKYDPALGSFKAWLLNMARWRITDELRRRPMRAPADAGLAKIADGHAPPDLDQIWEREWEKNLFDAATANARRRVDPKQYQIFDFYVNKNWPPERVAQTLAVSLNQVYLAKTRVTEAIRVEVERLKKEIL